MRRPVIIMVSLLPFAPVSHGQVTAPAAVSTSPGTRLFLPDGTIHYAVTLSEAYERGDAIPHGSLSLTTISGDLSYSSSSIGRPFHMLYTGGWRGTSSSAQPSTSFHNLTVTQGFNLEKWVASISNQFSYLPESPSTGLSGIPGLGDLGLQISQPSMTPAAGLLTNYGTLIEDRISGDANRQLRFDTSFTGTATWSKRLFLEGSGIDTAEVGSTAGVYHRLSARTNLSADYSYSRYAYSAFGFSFVTNGLNAGARHQWSRSLTSSISVGPQWTSSSDPRAVPSQLHLALSAGANYSRRYRSAQISYARGAVGGSGLLPGAFTESVQGSVQQSFRRIWAFALTGTYTKLSGLSQGSSRGRSVNSSGNGTSRYIGLQCTRALGRSFSTYASYTAQFQSFDRSLAARNAFTGISQIIGAGITFSPQSKHLGQL